MIVGLIMMVFFIATISDSLERIEQFDSTSQSYWVLTGAILFLCVNLAMMWVATDLIQGSVSKKEDTGQNYNININDTKSNSDERNS